MAHALWSTGDGGGGPEGYTYGAVVVRVDALPPGAVLAALREARFSGWAAEPEDGWTVAVAAAGAGTVAEGRRGVADLGAWLAERLGTTVVAIRVLDDRQLFLAVWADGAETGRYVSDPAHGLGPDDDTLPEPVGVEHAGAFAAACGRPESAGELDELLAEELDPDSVIESERLAGVLRVLGLPRWIVASASLPRDVPAGPKSAALTRLHAGVPGPAGRLRALPVERLRRRRPPPSPVPEGPRPGPDADPWLL